jgi:hypothetical protein
MKSLILSALAALRRKAPAEAAASSLPPAPTEPGVPLFASLNRNFFDLWLDKVRSSILDLPADSDPQIGSFICQVAAAACLQETGIRPSPNEADLDGCMHLVAALWMITPMGAMKRLGAPTWQSLMQIPWRDPDSAWHNLLANAETFEFRKALASLYSKNFPQLTNEDCGSLACRSPVIAVLTRAQDCIQRDAELAFEFLAAFHKNQIEAALGADIAPWDDRATETLSHTAPDEWEPDRKEAFVRVLKASPILMAHRTRSIDPPFISHEESLRAMTTTGNLAVHWRELLHVASQSGLPESSAFEGLLQPLFLCSYGAARQLLESNAFKEKIATNAVGLIAFLTDALKHYYDLTFPQLTQEQRENLLCRNPVFIYLSLRAIKHKPKDDELTSQAREFLRVYSEHNTGPRKRKVFATSDFKVYANSLRDLRTGGELIGIMAHEIGHNMDDIAPERAREVLDKILTEFSLTLTPEDYAKYGEEELFADVMALSFHARLGGDESRQNDLIYEYARRRQLPEHLYRPFMKKGVPDPGLTLDRSIAVDQLVEEYHNLHMRRCTRCGGEFDRQHVERKSYVVYHERVHDVLRLHCMQCGQRQDFFFDFTNTIPGPMEVRENFVKKMASIHGEVTDPIPEEIFAWAPPAKTAREGRE